MSLPGYDAASSPERRGLNSLCEGVLDDVRASVQAFGSTDVTIAFFSLSDMKASVFTEDLVQIRFPKLKIHCLTSGSLCLEN